MQSHSGNSKRRLRLEDRIHSYTRKTRDVSVSARRNSLSIRYPANGAWPAEMRIDMLAAYLDFRTVRELVLAVSRGEAPPPTRYRAVGRAREAIWVKVIVDEHVAPGVRVRQNSAKVNLAALT